MPHSFELPYQDRVIKLPEEYDEIALARYLEEMGTAGADFELEKTPRDLEIINFADQSVWEYLQRYGRTKNIEVPQAKIHIFMDGGVQIFTMGRWRDGAHASIAGSIIVDRKESDIQFVLLVFHELFHTKSYQALQISIGEQKRPRPYRSGFAVTSRDGEKTYFTDMEEAITSLMTTRFYEEKLLNSPLFAKETKNREKLPEISRQEELKKLNKLIDVLWEINRDSFASRDEIMDLFIDAQINGGLLKIGRLIEKTFGKGSFRRIDDIQFRIGRARDRT